MTAADAPQASNGPRTSQLLVILYEYLQTNTPAFPGLLPAVDPLREAVRLYGRQDTTAAFNRGVGVYQFLQRVRAQNPGLPVP